MSVEALAAAVERVIVLSPKPALREAAASLEQARATLADITLGTTDLELLTATEGLSHAANEIVEVRHACERLEILLRGYLFNLGVAPAHVTIKPVSTSTFGSSRPSSDDTKPEADRELLADAQRNGHKINSTRLVRIARAWNGRVVWLEEGDHRSGLQHLMKPERVTSFEKYGVPSDKIVQMIFDAVARKAPVGFAGKDRAVYEIDVEGVPRRIAITISSNGYIVGANPISMSRKLRESP